MCCINRTLLFIRVFIILLYHYLERIIDGKDKIITHLKHDNKTLAKEVSDLIEEKKRMLDNRS